VLIAARSMQSRAGMGPSILIVDSEVDGVMMLRAALQRRGYEVVAAASAPDALAHIAAHRVDVVLAHLTMTGMSGVELCALLHEQDPDLPTIVLTGQDTIENAVAAIRAGAYDFIVKPINLDDLSIAIDRAVTFVNLSRELHRLRDMVATSGPIDGVIGDSEPIRRVTELVHKVAASDATVLILGESGTGKELIARAIHDRSPRRDQPFAVINCAAVPASLLESELFGHVRGAFTDAHRGRAGVFVSAGSGTIFLDEIGEMPLEMQVKLLRVLQERRVRPVGGDQEVHFDARVITATNRNLETDVHEKRFREDLYYRINVVQIEMPPLRVRSCDLLPLAQHFIRKIAARTGKAVIGLSAPAARALAAYDWPGNVRELENSLERAIALTSVNEIQVDDLPQRVREHRGSKTVSEGTKPDQLPSLDEVEHRYVRQVLGAVGGNKTMAARILGIDRRSLYRRLEGEARPVAQVSARAAEAQR
jgi:DNA-binding NtrC family response regulator